MRITILTATYNRCDLLPKLYESIVQNYKTFKDLEWIIMDDGSLDDTKKIVDKWVKKEDFKIEYHYQENQGKMRAINNGMQYVTGDIVIEIDSDDYLMDNVLTMVSDDYEKLDNDNVYGIAYKRKLIGKDNTVEDIDKKGQRGSRVGDCRPKKGGCCEPQRRARSGWQRARGSRLS